MDSSSAQPTKPVFGGIPFDSEEQVSINANLQRYLGPEYVSQRSGPGSMKLNYLEGWKAISIANEIFGFNGWSYNIVNMSVDFMDMVDGRISVGVSAVVRVTLRDGTFHEDVGFGSTDNARTKTAAFEKVRKEAVTDGLKRALRGFGNCLGNCLHDKEYLKKVKGVKSVGLRAIDLNDLYRSPENRHLLTGGASSSTTFQLAPQAASFNRGPAGIMPPIPRVLNPAPRPTFAAPQPPRSPAGSVANIPGQVDDMFDPGLDWDADLVTETMYQLDESTIPSFVAAAVEPYNASNTIPNAVGRNPAQAHNQRTLAQAQVRQNMPSVQPGEYNGNNNFRLMAQPRPISTGTQDWAQRESPQAQRPLGYNPAARNSSFGQVPQRQPTPSFSHAEPRLTDTSIPRATSAQPYERFAPQNSPSISPARVSMVNHQSAPSPLLQRAQGPTVPASSAGGNFSPGTKRKLGPGENRIPGNIPSIMAPPVHELSRSHSPSFNPNARGLVPASQGSSSSVCSGGSNAPVPNHQWQQMGTKRQKPDAMGHEHP
ncbi:uncharacterized protein BJ171DRAFT_221778 [Polychytrium aggregatum]|uniref:uncharacterized protein n=1 Tax=Polychytrium aggregatum TaxID=110093 RepID=UPI0022FEE68A|nr:uncharacterized protein BJ171DRAFT_221778 [Polychytrium aggregatum]KAI9197506.1 hypothetical protein BJ171DRAFT_221778 [Polychytrium aggregatum]